MWLKCSLYGKHFNHIILLIEMLTENWKILLDYKSELNVKKYSPNGTCVLLFWEVKGDYSCWICDKQHQSSLVNYMPTTRQWEIQNSNLFSPDFWSTQNMVQVIGGKIVLKWSEEKQKLLRVSRRFELLRVRVTDGTILQ